MCAAFVFFVVRPLNKWNMRVDHIQLHHSSWTAIVKSWQKKRNKKEEKKNVPKIGFFLSSFVLQTRITNGISVSGAVAANKGDQIVFRFYFTRFSVVVAVVVFGRNNGKTVAAAVAWKTVIFIFFFNLRVFLSLDRASLHIHSAFVHQFPYVFVCAVATWHAAAKDKLTSDVHNVALGAHRTHCDTWWRWWYETGHITSYLHFCFAHFRLHYRFLFFATHTHTHILNTHLIDLNVKLKV